MKFENYLLKEKNMKFENYLLKEKNMKFENYLLMEENKNFMLSILKNLAKFSDNKVKSILRNSWKKASDLFWQMGIEDEVIKSINKYYGTNYNNLKEINRINENFINEGWIHWWNKIKSEAFPTLAFYPALQTWFEIDSLISGQDVNTKKLIIYGLFWVLLISSKYWKEHLKWKSDNPEEFEKEKEMGLQGIIPKRYKS